MPRRMRAQARRKVTGVAAARGGAPLHESPGGAEGIVEQVTAVEVEVDSFAPAAAAPAGAPPSPDRASILLSGMVNIRVNGKVRAIRVDTLWGRGLCGGATPSASAPPECRRALRAKRHLGVHRSRLSRLRLPSWDDFKRQLRELVAEKDGLLLRELRTGTFVVACGGTELPAGQDGLLMLKEAATKQLELVANLGRNPFPAAAAARGDG
eukprot:gene9900-18806_t